MATPMFIFGGNTGVASPKELKRLRSIAEALNGPQRAPQNIGEGLNAIGQALLYRSTEGKAERMEREGQESAAAAFNPILDALTGKPTASGSSGNVANALFGQPEAAAELAATSPKAGSTFTPFIDTVKAGGLTNPYGLAAVASTGERESGWSPEKAVQTWSDPSESGQPGRAGGIMSWRGPRYQALAAAGDMSPEGQARFFLNENPQLIQALNGAKSVEEAQGLINKAWAFAGYDRPGGEAARRLSLAHGYLPQFQGQGGTQVASLDPAAGMTTAAGAIDAIAPQSGQTAAQNAAPAFDAGRWGDPIKLSEMPAGAGDLGQRLGVQANSYAPPIQNPSQPTPQSGGLPELPFRQVGPTPQVAGQPMQQPQQQAQPPVRVAQAQAGPSLPQLYQALQNPWLNEGQQQMILGEIQRQQQMADPMRALQMQKLQREIAAPIKRDTTTVNGRLVDAQTGQVIASIPDQTKPTNDQQNYEYYRDFENKNGRKPLGPLEWEQAQRKAGASSTNVSVGESDKFYENLDKKNAETFATLSEGGMNARSRAAQLGQLETLLQQSPSGAEAGLKLWLGDLGIPTEGIDGLQATRALVEKMVPEQRAPGSGPMSDADIVMFRRSLASALNQPGGNALILGTAKSIAGYDMQMGAIADAVADREITPAEGRKRIRELANPLADYTKRLREIGVQNSADDAVKQGKQTRTGVNWSVD